MTFAQEPISNFRRDVVAEDELRIQAEAEVRHIIWIEHVRLAAMVRRAGREVDQTYVDRMFRELANPSSSCELGRRCSAPDCLCRAATN